MPTEIHPIPGTEMLAQFNEAVANRFAIAEDSGSQPLETNTNLGLRLLVPQRLEPFSQWLTSIAYLVSEDFDHRN